MTQPRHIIHALAAVSGREIAKFMRQRSRLISALVRPTLWLAVFAAGFQNVFGVSIVPPYQTYITYQEYIAPGLLGIILLFQGMQSSLSMVYDREMGIMRLLLTAPLPRWVVLFCKLAGGTVLSILQAYAFVAICYLFGVPLPPAGLLPLLPALMATGFMLGALGLLLSVYIRQIENFAGAMNFVIFPMFFMSSALYPLWKLRESGAEAVFWLTQVNPFTYGVELIRFALYGMFNAQAAGIVILCGLAFFGLACRGYDPQRGVVGRSGGDRPGKGP